MSKTDKDTPHWVRARRSEEDRQPVHRCHSFLRGRFRYLDSCDIDEPWSPDQHRRQLCFWVIRSHQPYINGTPPKKLRSIYYWKPDRSRTRAVLDDLARSWATEGQEMDDSGIRLSQHRHSRSWPKRYWD